MKHLLLITFLIITLTGYSQNESYIEVKVSETINLTADKIIYKVSDKN